MHDILDNVSEEQMRDYEARIARFTLMDDTFMAKVFEDKACVEYLLKVILKKDFIVKEIRTQFNMRNIHGHSAVLDIFAVDSENKRYDIEVQRDDDGANPERARYNSALIDTNSLKKGQDYKDLPDVYVIFITENDVLKGNKPIYTIERTVSELGHKSFDDRSHIIYVNGKFRDNSEIGKLMHDFSCNSVSEMNNSVLKDRTAYFKEKQEGKTAMCRIMEELKEETAEKVTAENSRKIALRLLESGEKSLEKIALLTDLPLSEVKKLAEQK